MRPHRRQPTRPRHPWDSPGKNTGVGCHFLLQCMKWKVKGDCSLPGSSVRGIFQARVLEWGAIAFSGCGSWGHKESDMSEWLNWTEPAIMLGDNKKQCVIKYWNCKTAISAIKEEKKESHHFVVDVRGRWNLNWVLRDRQDLKSWKKRKHYSRHHSRNRRQYEYLHVRWIWNVWRHSKEISLARGNEVEAYSSVQFSRSVMSGTRQGQKGRR